MKTAPTQSKLLSRRRARLAFVALGALGALGLMQTACGDDQKVNDRHEQILRDDDAEKSAARSSPAELLKERGGNSIEGKCQDPLV